jgi:CRP-like cAMP-binding protein
MTLHDLAGNRILRLLPQPDAEDLLEILEPVHLAFKEPIYSIRRPIDFVYFPLTSVISLVMDTEEGFTVEAGTVGREGMVGLAAFLGNSLSPWRTLCQISGAALRLPSREFTTRVSDHGKLTLILLRYTNAVVSQLAQTAACNRAHPLEERMCRWLLMTRDRVDSDDFPLTQEFLGQMLGVRRPAVSLAGSALQNAGLIRYSRGRVTVIDRAGLEAAACECYRVVRDQFEEALRI